MATQSTHSHMTDGKLVPCNNPVFGPFGDKVLHGSKLMWGTAKSDPAKRKPTDKLKHDAWCFSYYRPANVGELQSFVKSKPDNVMDLVDAALETEARQASWHENRGGTTTTRVSIDGAAPGRVPNEIIEMLRKAGHKVTAAPKE